MRKGIQTFTPKEYKWIIPSAIDLPTILEKHPPTFSNKIDYFYYIIHTLCDKQDYIDPTDDTKWIQLNATRLRKVIHGYNQYLGYLVLRDVILVNPSYKVGERSKGYKISSQYYQGEPVIIDVSKSMLVLRKKLKEYTSAPIQENAGHDYEHLSKWYNPLLRIDAEAARKEINAIYPLTINTPMGQAFTFNELKKFRALRAVQRIADGDFYYKIDDNIGRFHSNLTNIKKDLRKFLTYNGERLVNLDIKNSQPLLSGILLKKAFYGSEENWSIKSLETVMKLLKNDNKVINKVTDQIGYTIMLSEIPITLAYQEFEHYLSLIQGGTFYENLSNLLDPTLEYTQARKEEVKSLLFTIFFVDNRHGLRVRKLEAPFVAAFPNVHKIFSVLKRHNKAILSHILQRTESELIIERITRRIAGERPDLPIFTVHDSIATTEGNEDYVKDVMIDEIRLLTGLNASIGKEYWFNEKEELETPVNSLAKAA